MIGTAGLCHFKETLSKLILLMVRQAHHERNQPLTVRPEPVEGLNLSIITAQSGNHIKGCKSYEHHQNHSTQHFPGDLLGAGSMTALAEETATNSNASISETITDIEKALVESLKATSMPRRSIKSGTHSAANISGHEEIVKKANAFVIQGQIIAKKGDIKNSSAELNKALALYKSL